MINSFWRNNNSSYYEIIVPLFWTRKPCLFSNRLEYVTSLVSQNCFSPGENLYSWGLEACGAGSGGLPPLDNSTKLGKVRLASGISK